MKHEYFFLILIFIILLVSGCKECKISSDCNSKIPDKLSSYSNNCLGIKCVDNTCKFTPKSDCCGNKDCERDKGETECSCQDDCGKCSGKAKVQSGSKKIDAEYLEYGCENNKCMLTFDKSAVRTLDLYDDKTLSYFTWDVTTSIDQPFDIDNSKFKVTIELKDTNENLVLPISITKLKLIDKVEKGLIVGQKETEETLTEIGDSITGIIPINSDSMKDIEEEKKIELVIEYNYKIKVKAGTNTEGEPIYEEKIERKTYSNTYDSKIFFINPGENN